MRLAPPLPHYLRFARTLALVGGLGLAACSDGGTTQADASNDTTVADTTVADTALDDTSAPDVLDDTAAADTTVDCDACVCGNVADGGGVPACESVCCVAVGPLYPPDLPA